MGIAAQHQYLVIHLQFIVGAGIDDVRAITLDGHDAGAGSRPQFQFADEPSLGG